jgi:glutaredoxin
VSTPLLKLFAGIALGFGLLLAWSHQRAVERHDPRRTNGASDILLLSASWCGYCKSERRALVAAGVPFRELDVEDSDEGRNAYESVGGHGVPVTVIGQELVFGFDASRINDLLGARGYKVNLQ